MFRAARSTAPTRSITVHSERCTECGLRASTFGRQDTPQLKFDESNSLKRQASGFLSGEWADMGCTKLEMTY